MRLTLLFAVLMSLSTAWAGNVFLGIFVDAEPVAMTLNGSRQTGMRVASVSPGSPADRAGIQQGDLLLKLNDTIITDEDRLAAFLENRNPGDKIACTIGRNGKSLRYTVVLATRADSTVSKFSLRWNAGVALNAQLEELTPQMRSYFGVRNGVLIKQVDTGGTAARAGLRAGDVLTAIAGEPVNSLKDVTTGLFQHSSEARVPLTINRKGAVRKTSISIDRASAWTQEYNLNNGERVVLFGPDVDNMPVIDMNLMDSWLQTVVPDYPGMLDSDEMQLRLEELEREMEQWLKEWESR